MAEAEASAVQRVGTMTRHAETMRRDVVKTYGRVDILVNNAGITRDNLADEDERGRF